MTIPKIIHQYWTGGPVPDHLMQYSNAWSNLNPGWTHYLWTHRSLAIHDPDTGLDNADLWRRAEDFVDPGRQHQLRADIVRYELLERFGGVWIDMDFEPLRPLNFWFAEVNGDDPFAVWETQDEWIANGMMGSPKGHWFMGLLSDRLQASADANRGATPSRIAGPQYMTRLWREQGQPMTVLGPERFYPYLWSDLNRGNRRSRPPWPAECVAVHHWNNKRQMLKVKRGAANDTSELTAHRKSAVMNVSAEDLIGRVILKSRRWYEQDLLEDAYHRLRGRNGIVLDVGAHVGNHTLWFAEVCERPVIAVEPNLDSAVHMHSHVRMNQLTKTVEIYNVALGAEVSRGRIEPGPEGNTGMARVVADDAGTTAIVTLDSLVEHTRWSGVALIKIDVEGSALAVLEGAVDTLEHSRPLLYIEGEQDELQAFLGPKWRCFGQFGRTPTFGFVRQGTAGWGAPSGS